MLRDRVTYSQNITKHARHVSELSVWIRGMQKTDDPNKLAKTDQTVAKFLVWFRFHFTKTEIFGFGFSVGFFHIETDRIYIYIYIYSCNSSTELISGLVVCSLWFA